MNGDNVDTIGDRHVNAYGIEDDGENHSDDDVQFAMVGMLTLMLLAMIYVQDGDVDDDRVCGDVADHDGDDDVDDNSDAADLDNKVHYEVYEQSDAHAGWWH